APQTAGTGGGDRRMVPEPRVEIRKQRLAALDDAPADPAPGREVELRAQPTLAEELDPRRRPRIRLRRAPDVVVARPAEPRRRRPMHRRERGAETTLGFRGFRAELEPLEREERIGARDAAREHGRHRYRAGARERVEAERFGFQPHRFPARLELQEDRSGGSLDAARPADAAAPDRRRGADNVDAMPRQRGNELPGQHRFLGLIVGKDESAGPAPPRLSASRRARDRPSAGRAAGSSSGNATADIPSGPRARGV